MEPAGSDRDRVIELLRVAVADVGWRSELQSLAPRYLASINRYTVQAVRKIEFVILPSESADQGPC